MNNGVTERLDLSSAPRSVRLARRFLGRILRELDVAVEAVGVAELAVSELVTNAVVHGLPPIVMSVESSPTTVTVSVTDANPVRPRAGDTRLDATGGRGLAIVAALAGPWGYDLDGPGKRVWFTVGR